MNKYARITLWLHFLTCIYRPIDASSTQRLYLVIRSGFIGRIPKRKYSFPKKHSMDLFRKRTIPAEQPPLVYEVSDNFCG
jgi:hypothetical protein